ncbi:MAG: tRNA (adenosine(37)-N6)-threonylcarbamoyltransferase complex dimerization subunit type 1 TsaB [Bdellovibrionota bacterium]
MAVLALETTSRTSYVALAENGAILVERSSADLRGAEVLAQLISSALDDGRLSFDSISEVLVGIGPGSFTGIRTGLAAAAGLRAATGVRLRGVSTLLAGCVLADPNAACVLPILRANPNESYCCILELEWSSANSKLIVRTLGEVEAVKTELIRSEERFQKQNGLPVELLDLDQLSFQHQAPGNSPASVLARFAYDVDQSRSIFPQLGVQAAVDGLLPSPLYIKEVHAKTLSERGIERRNPLDIR